MLVNHMRGHISMYSVQQPIQNSGGPPTTHVKVFTICVLCRPVFMMLPCFVYDWQSLV